MTQNPKYNKGKPWFVSFRPLLHSPVKLPAEDIDNYRELSAKLDRIEAAIDELKAKKVDTTDLELELSLAKDKLKSLAFSVVDIYIESIEKRLRRYK